jgi:hypothetical protein
MDQWHADQRHVEMTSAFSAGAQRIDRQLPRIRAWAMLTMPALSHGRNSIASHCTSAAKRRHSVS